MAGTLTEKATLASDNTFISKVRAAMLTYAVGIVTNTTAQPFAKLLQANSILQGAGAGATNMAWLVVIGYSPIGSAAPVVPSDAATQTGVEAVLAVLP